MRKVSQCNEVLRLEGGGRLFIYFLLQQTSYMGILILFMAIDTV